MLSDQCEKGGASVECECVYTFAHDTGKEQTESGKHVVSGHSSFLEVNPQT